MYQVCGSGHDGCYSIKQSTLSSPTEKVAFEERLQGGKR